VKIRLPKADNYTLCLSGGVDSVSLAYFLQMGRKSFDVIHFDNKNKMAPCYRNLVECYCIRYGIKYETYEYNGKPSESNEKIWAEWRKSILANVRKTSPILTAHHQDDRIESNLMGRQLLYNKDNIYRPFIEVPKQQIIEYATAHNLIWLEDPTNSDPNFCRRNKIRNQLIPLMRECGVSLEKFYEY
jgi:tRNA(Ile)-lysidine synthase